MGWRCSLHGVIGAGNDGSLRAHELARHDGAQIAVMMLPDPPSEQLRAAAQRVASITWDVTWEASHWADVVAAFNALAATPGAGAWPPTAAVLATWQSTSRDWHDTKERVVELRSELRQLVIQPAPPAPPAGLDRDVEAIALQAHQPGPDDDGLRYCEACGTWWDPVAGGCPTVVAARKRGVCSGSGNLGLATTRELLAELAARIEVDGANGGGGLDYRTVDGRPS